MAIKPTSNDAFYKEVDEELRRDRFANFWGRYRWAILVGVVLLLVAIAGSIWWIQHRQTQREAQGEQFSAALDSMEKGQFGAVGNQLTEVEKSSSDGYRVAALMSRADALVAANNLPGAAAIFGGIAADESLAEPYRQAALIRQTEVQFDTLQPDQIIQRLQPLARRGEPWHGSAGEMIGFAHLRANRAEQAATVFAAIAADETVPETIRSRAVQLAGAHGAEAVPQMPVSPAAQAGAPVQAPAAQQGTAQQAAPAAPAAPATKE